MKANQILKNAVAGLALASFVAAPVVATAQSQASKRRQQTKNEWRNIAIGSGIVGLLGLLKGDKFLTFAGAAGALYSLDRYEKDRKSQSRIDRARAQVFSRSSFTRDGQTYRRKLVKKNGKTYYQFVRVN